jgi:hypothetical protein
MQFVFGDLYKPVKDLLSKNFNGSKNSIEIKKTAADGVILSSNVQLGGAAPHDITFEVPLKVHETRVTLKTNMSANGKLKATATIPSLRPGLKIETVGVISSNPADPIEGEVLGQYQTAKCATSLKAILRQNAIPLFVFSTCTKFRNFYFGGSLEFDRTLKTLKSYALGYRYAATDYTIAAQYQANHIQVGCVSTVKPGLTLGIEFDGDVPKATSAVSMAAEYKATEKLTCKGKATSKGELSTSAQYQVDPSLKATLSADIQPATNNIRWGLVFNYES